MSEMLKIKAILGGWGRIVSCPLRVDQVQIIFLVFHTIQIQMRNTSWHSHAWWFKESSGPCFQSFVFCSQSCFLVISLFPIPIFKFLLSVPNPCFLFDLGSSSRFSGFLCSSLFPIHLFLVWSLFLIQVSWFSGFISFPGFLFTSPPPSPLPFCVWSPEFSIKKLGITNNCRLQNIGTTWYIRLRHG